MDMHMSRTYCLLCGDVTEEHPAMDELMAKMLSKGFHSSYSLEHGQGDERLKTILVNSNMPPYKAGHGDLYGFELDSPDLVIDEFHTE